MRQYGIDQVEASWAGLDLKEGIAVGTAIQEAASAQRFSQKPTGVGGVVRVYNPDRSGTLTITVDQESKTHQQLQEKADLDRTLRNQVYPFVVIDNTSGEKYTYRNAYIMGEPDESRGTESATFQWVFGYEEKKKELNLFDNNVVGS